MMLRVLGKGGYGIVKEAKSLNQNSNTIFAIKSTNKRQHGAEKLHRIYKEINVLSSLDNPNIIKLY
jgi:serine/threonine protein kinase